MPPPEGLKFRETHEWVNIDRDSATIGISAHAADELGDVVLVMLPEIGRTLSAGEQFGEIESLKAVSDLYSPISGTVTEVNDVIAQNPEIVNNHPYGQGWLIKIQISDASELSQLMDVPTYQALIQEA
jgi:glycine cleavage system H protein